MRKQPQSPFLRDLDARGVINACTDIDGLDAKMAEGPVTAYAGFDATADGLHVGHLATISTMRRLARAGHKVIVLLGGATSRVGDPSFRAASRPMMDDRTIAANTAGVASDLANALRDVDVEFVDNSSWLGEAGFLEFMRDVGAHFTVARMLAMDAVKSRIDAGNPLSMLEFSYMMLQAADFAELARTRGCALQLGGSDQWGNICNGIELARRRDGAGLFGLTTRLLTTSDGQKMGKTANGAVWLSKAKLDDFSFWQFWRNVADEDVTGFLAMLTDMEMPEIAALMAATDVNAAKERLANEVTAWIRGPAAAERAAEVARSLFGGSETGEATHVLAVGDEGIQLAALLVEIGMTDTKGEARRAAAGGGVKVDGDKVPDVLAVLAKGRTVAVSVGKRRKAMVRLE